MELTFFFNETIDMNETINFYASFILCIRIFQSVESIKMTTISNNDPLDPFFLKIGL